MDHREKSQNHQNQWNKKDTQKNECPKKDKDGDCLVPGIYSDSDPVGGG